VAVAGIVIADQLESVAPVVVVEVLGQLHQQLETVVQELRVKDLLEELVHQS
jgi:hypothetical protein